MPVVHIPTNLVQTRATNTILDGLLWGWHWGATDWGYSFPTSVNEYATFQPQNYNGYLGFGYENVVGFQPFNAQQQSQIVAAVGSFETFLPVSFKPNASLGQDAPVVFRFAVADAIDYGYGLNGIGDQSEFSVYNLHGPGGGRSAEAAVPDPFQMNWRAAGDTWYITNAYDTPVPGSFSNAAGLLHEFGHAMGLKHGHHTQPVYGPTNQFVDQFGSAFAEPVQVGTAPALPTEFDGQEFTVMTYSVYIGDNSQVRNEANDLPLNQVDYPWSYMMLDIAALQYLYGANFGSGSNPGDTVYNFNPSTGQMAVTDSSDGQLITASPQNAKIFTTIWDGGGTDTYDFSNYTTDQVINLQPGQWSTFSPSQLARLGVETFARGNIANALQFNGDTRSLIENAVGGSGNDVFAGNAANNIINGGLGNDTILFDGNRSDFTFTNNNGFLTVTGNGGSDTLVQVENLHFNDVVSNVDEFLPSMWQSQPDNIKLTASVYQLLTGRIPTANGFEYLIDSSQNNSDLNDPYYEQFNQENRYINFANNLGSLGEGKQAFSQEYGALSFEQTVRSAYAKTIGGTNESSIQFFLNAQTFYQAVAQERVVPSGVSLDLATKVVAVGSILNEAVKSGAGTYAAAVDSFANEIQTTGTSSHLGMDLFAVA